MICAPFSEGRPSDLSYRDHAIDLAFGARWNPFGTFFLNTNVKLPMNKDAGLRADSKWTVRVEYAF